MMKPARDRLVRLSTLPVGAHFTFSLSQEGVVVDRLPGGVKIMLKERKDGRWQWRECTWSPEMRVVPDIRPVRGTSLRVGVKAIRYG